MKKALGHLVDSLSPWIGRFDVLSRLRPGGTLVLNTAITDIAKLEAFLPVAVGVVGVQPASGSGGSSAGADLPAPMHHHVL